MFWETLWALVLGFALSGAVQAFVSRDDMQRVMGDHRPAAVARSTGFGMVSSSCSYAATAMAKSLFQKGADFVSSMVFMFASTNLVIELGVVLFVLMGWQFAAAEFIGGPIMIVLLVIVGRLRVQPSAGRAAPVAVCKRGTDRHRRRTDVAELERTPWRQKLTSTGAWADAASYTIADIKMLRKELVIGYGIAGFLAVMVPMDVWNDVFFTGHGFWTTLENVILGPFIAFISFVCSVGNVPMAAALWHGGISFGGVISFIFADLIALPLVLIYRKYYGTPPRLRLFFTFWLVMSTAGLIVEGLFAVLGVIPETQAAATSCHTGFEWNYTTFLNIVFLMVFAVLYWLYRNRDRLHGEGGVRTTHSIRCAACRCESLTPRPHAQSRRQDCVVLLGRLCGAVRRKPQPIGGLSGHDSIVTGCFRRRAGGWRCSPSWRSTRAGRRRSGMGAAPPDRLHHERGGVRSDRVPSSALLGVARASPRVIVVAVLGALVVTLLAKWSPVIRGHGIPEAMEAVLTKQSRISPRGRRSPSRCRRQSPSGRRRRSGRKGPIIVTGGALGSLLGQVVRVSPAERKILLACGAAAGMSATFGSPLGRGDPRCRAAAVRVLRPGARAVDRRHQRRGRRAQRPVRLRTTVPGPGARLRGARRTAGIRRCSGSPAACSASSSRNGLFFVEAGYRRLPFGEFWHPIVGAVAFASVGLLAPRALGVGLRRHRRRPQQQAGADDRRRARHGEAGQLVARARIRHLGRNAGADPADQRVVRHAGRHRASTTCCPDPTSRPARSRSLRWQPRSGRRPARPSPPSCSCSS